ncbi:MAG: phosphate ABC transporter permease subunit PstC [Synergistaceae bacterium]|jgi:phosphate transport system permease protein|nr:phosphate ABC transporter permease subunit PstC [Synergistaceae bacterium]
MERPVSLRDLKEKSMSAVFFTSALISIFAVGLICFFLLGNGLPAIMKIGAFRFLLGREWSPSDMPPAFGIFPMILGSLCVTAGAIVIGVPVGVLSAVYLAKACPEKLYRLVKPGVELLAGIPSVVYGFFGMVVIVPVTGNSILSACILLGIMILPTVIGIAESAIRAVPESYYEGALALGAGHFRSVFFVVVPAAKSGIFAAVVLGIGRAIGETMAVIMVAGNQARMPVSLMKGVRTLTANIVIEMGYAADFHREVLFATGVVLFLFVLATNLSFSALKRRGKI